MKLTNNEVVQAQAALLRLSEIRLPIKVSLDVALILNSVDERVKAFELVRNRLYQTYSIRVDQGETPRSVVFRCTDEAKVQENLEAFQREFNELLEVKTKDLDFQKIQLPETIDGQPLQIEPSVLRALIKFVEVK